MMINVINTFNHFKAILGLRYALLWAVFISYISANLGLLIALQRYIQVMGTGTVGFLVYWSDPRPFNYPFTPR